PADAVGEAGYRQHPRLLPQRAPPRRRAAPPQAGWDAPRPHLLANGARPQHALGDRPAVHFGGAVIDAERADLAEDLGDDRIVGDAEPAEDLHAAVDDAPDGFRADHLGHARYVAAALAFIQHPGGVPDD